MSYVIPKAKKTTSAKLKNDRWKAYLKNAKNLDRRWKIDDTPLEAHKQNFERYEEKVQRGFNQDAFDSKWKTDTCTYTRIGMFNAEGLKNHLAELANMPVRYETKKSYVNSNRLWSVIQLIKTYPKGTEFELFVADNMSAYKIVVGRNSTTITIK